MAPLYLKAVDVIVEDVRAYVSRCDVQSLADLTDIAPGTLYAIRNGALPTVRTLRRLCHAIDIGGGIDGRSRSQVETDRVEQADRGTENRPSAKPRTAVTSKPG